MVELISPCILQTKKVGSWTLAKRERERRERGRAGQKERGSKRQEEEKVPHSLGAGEEAGWQQPPRTKSEGVIRLTPSFGRGQSERRWRRGGGQLQGPRLQKINAPARSDVGAHMPLRLRSGHWPTRRLPGRSPCHGAWAWPRPGLCSSSRPWRRCPRRPLP